ncbi:MAG: ParA family protein [Bdellovibrionales bacterium]|nr:ParA family protein [Bdellovibrionales bacterium]
MTNVIALANQKGGVGKTTSAVSISAELALMGRKVLLVDFDPQGSASSGLGVDLNEEGSDLYDMFFKRVALSKIIKPSMISGLAVAPSSRDLVGIEIELGKEPGRELILKTELALIKRSYDYVIIDCPPSSGLLTLNALGAADYVSIPLQAEYYALEGLSALMDTIEFVRQTFNSRLELLGIFITMFDSRTRLSTQVDSEVRGHFGEKVFSITIPRNIKLSECPSHGQPICLYDPSSAGAIAYHCLTEELDKRCQKGVQEKLVANS